jgi:hypothetical protein
MTFTAHKTTIQAVTKAAAIPSAFSKDRSRFKNILSA